MSRHPLDPAFSKISRAKTHIEELNTAIREFLRSNPYRIEPKLNRKGDKEIWWVVPDCIPADIEAIAADAVHNLRVPLDKMLAAGFHYDKIHAERANIGSVAFPTGDDRKSFERALAGQKEHLTGAVIEFLETAKPHPGGRGALLWAVNKLDNRDKHRALLVPIKLAMQATELAEVKAWKGDILTIGSRRGQHMVWSVETGVSAMRQPNPALRPGYRVRPPLMEPIAEFRSAHDDMEIMTTTPGTKVEIDMQPVLDIAFSEIRGFEGEPVVNLLERAREAVKATLVTFRDRFF